MHDLTRELLDAQELDKPDSVIKDLQIRLNTVYDDFYKKYRLVHSTTNKRYFSEDVSYNLVAGLEKSYDKNVLKEKNDIFTKRTIVPPKALNHVETALETLTLYVAEKARVDFEYISLMTLVLQYLLDEREKRGAKVQTPFPSYFAAKNAALK